jgi:hypothetical protein
MNVKRKKKIKDTINKKLKNNKLTRFLRKEGKLTIREASSGKVKRYLSIRDAMLIAFMAIASALISAYNKLITFMRWSTFPDNSVFASWHPYVAPIAFVGIFLYIICLYAKGVTYWLAYFPAVIGIGYWAIEFSMIHSLLTPQDLANFFSAFGFTNIPELLTGPPLT